MSHMESELDLKNKKMQKLSEKLVRAEKSVEFGEQTCRLMEARKTTSEEYTAR